MSKFHEHYNELIDNKFLDNLSKKNQFNSYNEAKKDLFENGDVLLEAIFYAGTGIYEFQFMEFLEKKYKYDKEWLWDNRRINLEEIKSLTFNIHNFVQEKLKKINFQNDILEKAIIDDIKDQRPDDWKDIIPKIKLHKYFKLFEIKVENNPNSEKLDNIDKYEVMDTEFTDRIIEILFDLTLDGLINLFTFEKNDFKDQKGLNALLKNFSFNSNEENNSCFNNFGDFNILNEKPIMKLDNGKYFIPVPFILFKSIYESPFYWMMNDQSYKDTSGENRGKVGEEITYNFLVNVFGKDKTFKAVKVIQNDQNLTDIDVLCILGSKALCVQVKSKKLTLLSRTGNLHCLKKDFKGAVQDAYEQGLVSREKVINKDVKFFNENNEEIILSEDIDETYIMGITTEEYPSLTIQSNTLIDKKVEDPYPIFLTIFDLELLCYYLNDPYDFLYYIRQRISLMDYFNADEEIAFLGYHLTNKLDKIPDADQMVIHSDMASIVSQNYIPLKKGLNHPYEDNIKNNWMDENFENLCNHLKSLNFSKIADILFYLFDFNGETRSKISKGIIQTRSKTLNDNKIHNFTLIRDDHLVGLTYFSENHNDLDKLKNDLVSYCNLTKYKSKVNIWIGFASIRNSKNIIDLVIFNNTPWRYNKELEDDSKEIFVKNIKSARDMDGKKIGRNDKCPCGSGKKYKKCCLNKTW